MSAAAEEAVVPCSRQETCAVVVAACERKVAAESKARLAEAKLAEKEAEYARKRGVMNELYAAGVAMRKAQADYYAHKSQTLLEFAKANEARFDRALKACRELGKPVQMKLM